MSVTWSNSDKGAALRMYAAGVPVKEIAARFGKSRDAIYGVAHVAGVGRPDGYKWSVDREEVSWNSVRAVLAGSSGMTVYEICAASGIPGATVHNALHRHPEEVQIIHKVKTRAKPAPVWALVDVTAAKPRQVVGEWTNNPFAVAAGLVTAPSTGVGRIYAQSMNVTDGEMESA